MGSEVGTHDVIVAVGDGEFNVQRSFLLRVLNVNDPPVFVEDPIVVVREDELH